MCFHVCHLWTQIMFVIAMAKIMDDWWFSWRLIDWLIHSFATVFHTNRKHSSKEIKIRLRTTLVTTTIANDNNVGGTGLLIKYKLNWIELNRMNQSPIESIGCVIMYVVFCYCDFQTVIVISICKQPMSKLLCLYWTLAIENNESDT